MSTPVLDVHSYSRPEEVVVKDLDLHITVDFSEKVISGKASYKIENKTGADTLILDTRGLDIDKVTSDHDERATSFNMGENDPVMGKPLRIHIRPETKYVHIYYSSNPDAAAVQWLDARQTAGGGHPFMFTQSEAILARTWVPCQDSPGIRFTYTATVEVPEGLMAVMSADNPQEKSEDGIYEFEMSEPIPSYLLALAVGNFEFKEISKQTGVYAEPETLDKAVYEFADMEKMLRAAEALYGPYQWGRYDVIVLPPSFPFGGMENPKLTFATPTILAGDRSLVSLVAHELAHSWSGNLVTNATWNDFWLNEGFTVYFERRIMEALEGKEYANMLEVLGYQDLMDEIEDKGAGDADTKLKLDLEGRDPDDGMNHIAYEKGYFMLRMLEEKVGRQKLDNFLKKYFKTFSFQSMNTEQFLDYLKKELIGADKELEKDVNKWIYEPGVPASIPPVSSARFTKVDEELEKWTKGTAPAELDTDKWSSHEWLQFIRHLPDNMRPDQMKMLDSKFHFSDSGNSEILAAWFEHVIDRQYKEAYPQMEQFLKQVGRRKFILPLYKKMANDPDTRSMGRKIYKEARPNYHSVASSTIDELMLR